MSWHPNTQVQVNALVEHKMASPSHSDEIRAKLRLATKRSLVYSAHWHLKLKAQFHALERSDGRRIF